MTNDIQRAKTFTDFLRLLAFNFPNFSELLTAVMTQL